MLQNLHVKNLALIDEADVELEQGLNILTGETGAGKSIIIGSINLALGEKVPKEMLRDNDEPALVELVFDVQNPITLQKLRELDVEAEDGQIILSRKITAGRSALRINGETVSASTMKAVAALLIDIHGQHEHQSLLHKKKHLELVDAYGYTLHPEDYKALKQEVAEAYAGVKKLQEELDGTNLDEDARRRELSLLEYEVNEITEANLILGEDEELEQDFRRFTNGKKIMEAVSLAANATSGDGENASELIGRAVRELASVADYDDKLGELLNMLSDVDSLLSDFNHELSGYMDDADFDEEKFYQIEKRLDVINHLKSKYGHTLEAILASCEEKSQKIAKLLDYDAYLNQLRGSLAVEEKKLALAAGKLSDLRKETADGLCKAITAALLDLNFLDVRFCMDFKALEKSGANGIDDAEFLISTNPGEPLKPLVSVASGGELSRIMLAIKTVMAGQDAIDTLIFDEIDSGISGRTAQMVSEKMNELGKNHQIICITHLPQIAAMADAHYLIAKEVENMSTKSSIMRLSQDASIKELARMLGGVEITETVLMNAREMRDLALTKK